MTWVQTLAVVLHVLLAAGIIGLVLLQRGKGADAGAGFGAGASGTVFGARGSGSFLSRTTAILATLFFVTSLGLSYVFNKGSAPTSVVDRVQPQQTVPAPKSPPEGLLPSVPTEQGAAPAPASVPAPAQPPVSTPAQAPATQPAPAGQ
jgi:preprotein translocase subunit SecG